MTDLLKRVDPTKFYPPFLMALRAMLDEAVVAGSDLWVISGFRTYQEQSDLYDQGRGAPGSIVTHAKGGESSHNFGIAADLCLDSNIVRAGLQPDYRPESYEVLRELAPKHGLVWGGSWKFRDVPHVQLPNYVTAAQLAPLRHAYEMGGLLNAFAFLDGLCI